MKKYAHSSFFAVMILLGILSCKPNPEYPLAAHPDSAGWEDLFLPDLSNAYFPDSIWSFENGEFTATEDQFLWTKKEYNNFVLDLEFKNAEGTNSGVVVYCSNTEDWIPNSVEVQIADDFHEKWAKSPKNWQCGAIFGRQAATKSVVKKPGEWNRFTVTCIDSMIYVLMNGEQVNTVDLSKFTDAKINPDGSEAPSWLSKAPATLPIKGVIGFQGKHAGAPVYFRNIRIKEIV
ncbi:MAG: DUF1080 domain-containing protein [Cyclobacteriaceae bacterium]|nr:DUF1080 domain-containing protein [Cyclobacteriaceae bacterium]